MNEIVTSEPIEEGPASLLSALVKLAQNPSVQPETVAAWAAIQERMELNQAKVAYARSFALMEPKLPRIKKNGVVEFPVDKNRPDGPKKKAFNYAKWEDIDDAIRPILREHGFILTFNTRQRTGDGGGVVVIGKLKHSGVGSIGWEEVAEFALGLDTSGGKSNMQGYASSTSFGQRYCAKLLLNLVFEGEDDDAQKGSLSFINEDQQAEIIELVKATNTNPESFFALMCGPEVRSYTEIESRDFVRLKNALLAKSKKKGG